jgi:hypothetical protein
MGRGTCHARGKVHCTCDRLRHPARVCFEVHAFVEKEHDEVNS